jgi:hypothetical protein
MISAHYEMKNQPGNRYKYDPYIERGVKIKTFPEEYG